MKRIILTALAVVALNAALPTAAFAQALEVGGQIVGIQMDTDGVLVAGIGAVETAGGSCSPAVEAGVRQGDVIVEVAGQKVGSAGELIDAVAALDEAAA